MHFRVVAEVPACRVTVLGGDVVAKAGITSVLDNAPELILAWFALAHALQIIGGDLVRESDVLPAHSHIAELVVAQSIQVKADNLWQTQDEASLLDAHVAALEEVLAAVGTCFLERLEGRKKLHLVYVSQLIGPEHEV